MKESEALAEPAASPPPGVGNPALAALVFLAVLAVVFATRTAACWHDGELLAGDHADGPIRFAIELNRMSPEMFPSDLAVQSSDNLGPYEYFFRSLIALSHFTGWPLLKANLVVCWVANGLYLAGAALLLWRLQRSAWLCGLGSLLAAQPFVFISMKSGVAHSLAIPREIWLWPLPWFIMWFALGRREGWRLVAFYAALGATFSLTYPLWAALSGLAFGVADGWRFLQAKRYGGMLWLALGGGLCMMIVALPALSVARTVAGGESALLDYNEITRSVYWTKGFRRLLIFATLGWLAFRALGQRDDGPIEPIRRLQTLLAVSLGVCLIYEPFERLFPTLSLLYAGRLSLVVFLICMVGGAIWLGLGWRGWPSLGRGLAVAGLLVLLLDPAKRTFRDWRDPPAPLQMDFVNLYRGAEKAIPIDALCVVPPDPGTHYFRVYAQRGLWIHGKDAGVLSRTRSLYREAGRRLETVEAFYAGNTAPAAREALLNQLRTNGVTHVVTKTNAGWSSALSWPVVQSHGAWQLRAPDPIR